MASEGNRQYVPFAVGIEPYTSEIVKIPQGWEHYDGRLAHEIEAKAKAAVILKAAFPEIDVSEATVLWNYE